MGKSKGSPGDVRRIKAQRAAFLEAYARGGRIKDAADEAGVDRTTILRWRREDPDFAKLVADAEELGTQLLEDEAYRRAFAGVEEAVHYKGEVVDHVTKYSDLLLIFLLKARLPKKYRDNVSVETEAKVKHEVEAKGLSDELANEIRAKVLGVAAAAAAKAPGEEPATAVTNKGGGEDGGREN